MLFEQYEQDTIEEDGDRLARILQSIAATPDDFYRRLYEQTS